MSGVEGTGGVSQRSTKSIVDLGLLAAFRWSREVNELAWLRLTSISDC
jgi:hypothetical protein